MRRHTRRLAWHSRKAHRRYDRNQLRCFMILNAVTAGSDAAAFELRRQTARLLRMQVRDLNEEHERVEAHIDEFRSRVPVILERVRREAGQRGYSCP